MHKRIIRKLLLIWNISNQKLIEIFNQIQYFKLETIFVKRCADFLITDNGYELMQQLNTRYYINSFFSSGLISNSLHEEVVNFSRNQNLLLRAINSYAGVGSNETESLEFVFTFERVE